MRAAIDTGAAVHASPPPKGLAAAAVWPGCRHLGRLEPPAAESLRRARHLTPERMAAGYARLYRELAGPGAGIREEAPACTS